MAPQKMRYRQAQLMGREPVRDGTIKSEQGTELAAKRETPKPIVLTSLGDLVPADALACTSSGGGTRTPDTRIMIPLL